MADIYSNTAFELTRHLGEYDMFVKRAIEAKLDKNERLTKLYLSRHPELIGYKQLRKWKGIIDNMKAGE